MAAELGDATLEGVAGARGLLEEEHEDGLVAQDVDGLAQQVAHLELLGDLHQGLDLLVGPVLLAKKMPADHPCLHVPFLPVNVALCVKQIS